MKTAAEEVKEKWMKIVGGRAGATSRPPPTSKAPGTQPPANSKPPAALQIPKKAESKLDLKPRPKTARTKDTKRRLTGKSNEITNFN